MDEGPRMTTARGSTRPASNSSRVPVTMVVPVMMATLHAASNGLPSSGDRVPGVDVLSSSMSSLQPVILVAGISGPKYPTMATRSAALILTISNTSPVVALGRGRLATRALAVASPTDLDRGLLLSSISRRSRDVLPARVPALFSRVQLSETLPAVQASPMLPLSSRTLVNPTPMRTSATLSPLDTGLRQSIALSRIERFTVCCSSRHILMPTDQDRGRPTVPANRCHRTDPWCLMSLTGVRRISLRMTCLP